MDITEIKAYKKGHNGINVYTIHYKIMIEFEHYPPFKLTETGSESHQALKLENLMWDYKSMGNYYKYIF